MRGCVVQPLQFRCINIAVSIGEGGGLKKVITVSAVDLVELDAMATHHPIPSLSAALMYLRGQELKHLANRTIASQIHI